jgi:hypothetical protein
MVASCISPCSQDERTRQGSHIQLFASSASAVCGSDPDGDAVAGRVLLGLFDRVPAAILLELVRALECVNIVTLKGAPVGASE